MASSQNKTETVRKKCISVAAATATTNPTGAMCAVPIGNICMHIEKKRSPNRKNVHQKVMATIEVQKYTSSTQSQWSTVLCFSHINELYMAGPNSSPAKFLFFNAGQMQLLALYPVFPKAYPRAVTWGY